MELIRFLGLGSEDVDSQDVLHYPGASIDYTLCGITLDGDDKTAGPFEMVKAPAVTCPGCIATIKHCRGVRIQQTKNED